MIAELKGIPSKIGTTIASVDERVRAIARSHADRQFFLYLGATSGCRCASRGR